MLYSDAETESESDDLIIHSAPFIVSKIEAEIIRNREKINALLKKLQQTNAENQECAEEKKEDSSAPKKR